MRNNYAINQGSPPAGPVQSRRWLLSLWLLLCLMASSLAVFGQTVTSDKDDYSPGQVATITGSGWTADQMVHVEFKEEPDYPDRHVYDLNVDAEGNWVIKYVIEERHLGVKFTVTAVGQQSGAVATTVFTDAGIRNVNVTGSSFCAGQNLVVSFEAVGASVDGSPNGNFATTNRFNIQLSNASGSFSSPVNIGQVTGRTNTYTNIPAQIPNNTLSGSAYRIRVVSTDPVSNAPNNGSNLTISAQPSDAIAGDDQTVNGTSTTLAGNTPSVGTGAWSFIGDNTASTGGTIVTPSSRTSTFTGTAGKTYTLRWTISSGSCTSTDNVNVTFNPNNPLPVLTAISPTSKTVGDAAFILTVTGTNFISSSVIQLNGSARTTTFVSSTQLTASIPASDLTTAGTKGITVFTPTPGGGTSTTLNVNVNQAQPTISWVSAGTITYGTDLTGKLNATASFNSNTVPGTFVYKADGTVVSASTVLNAKATSYELTVDFTPTDATNYKSASGTNSITVNKAPATMTVTDLAKTYNGSAQGATVTTLPEGLAVNVSYSQNGQSVASPTAAGSYAVVAALNNSNYSAENGTGSLVIGQKELVGSFTASDKPYDGNTSATVVTRSVTGKVGEDEVSLSGGTASFASAAAGTGKTVTLTGATLAGADKDNYSLASVNTTTADITPLGITGSFTADNKVYDGNTSAAVLTRTLSGVLNGDAVTLTGGTATFSDKNVDNDKTVTLAGVSLAGAGAGNYSLASGGITTTADITKKELTGTFTVSDKVYDGDADATLTGRSLTGKVGSDDVELTGGTATFASATAGTGKTVTLTGATLAGADAANYSLSSVSTTTADITAKEITGSFTASNKPYDGTNAATVTGRSLNGAVAGDVVSLTGGTASFANANVGENKTVTLTGATLDGAAASNYNLTSVGTATADITAKSVTATVSVSNKEYDGTTSATIASRSLSGVLAADEDNVSLGTSGTANFATAAAGNNKQVNINGLALAGTASGNYSLASTPVTATADITPKEITGSFTASDKVYDGDADATVTDRSVNGKVGSDAVSLVGGTAAFATKNVGENIVVTLTGATLAGDDKGNYSLTSVATTRADITAKPLSAASTVTSKVYDGSAATGAVSLGTVTGLVGTETLTITATASNYATSTVGTDKATTISYSLANGANGGLAANYSMASLATTGEISAKPITGSFTVAASKVYDGNTTATVLTYSVSGKVGDDEVSLTGGTAAFADKNVGENIVVTLTGATLAGDDKGNYSLTSVATTTADITARSITVTANAATKEYDGTTASSVAPTVPALQGTDKITTAPTQTYDNKNVGTGKTLTASGLVINDGNSGNNYNVSYVVNTSGVIKAKGLTITTVILAPASRQYSDPNPVFTVKYEGFANGDNESVLEGTLSFAAPLSSAAPNAYDVTTQGLTSSNYAITFVPAQLTVTPEDARATYTGAVFASTSSATSSTATVTLSATIQDISATSDAGTDTYAGDIRNARVMFVNRDAGNAPISGWLTPGLVTATDSKTGTVTFNWSTSIGSASSQTFTIGIIVNNYYTRNASIDNETVTVSKPLNDFITGGGFITLTNASGQIRPKQGTKNNFGFNVKYNKGGTNLQGNINTIVRGEDGKVYQVKGNVMTSLAVNATTKTATFNGKANIQDITNPTAPISVDGNATLQVIMTDAGEPGTSDKIAITVWNKAGGLWFASNWSGNKTVEQLLAKGNLKVSSNSSFGTSTTTARTSAEPAAAESLEPMQINAYPNPFYDKFTLSFGKEVTEEAVISVVDMKGTTVYHKNIAAGSHASEVEIDMSAFRSGTYIVQTVIGAERKVTKVLKY